MLRRERWNLRALSLQVMLVAVFCLAGASFAFGASSDFPDLSSMEQVFFPGEGGKTVVRGQWTPEASALVLRSPVREGWSRWLADTGVSLEWNGFLRVRATLPGEGQAALLIAGEEVPGGIEGTVLFISRKGLHLETWTKGRTPTIARSSLGSAIVPGAIVEVLLWKMGSSLFASVHEGDTLVQLGTIDTHRAKGAGPLAGLLIREGVPGQAGLHHLSVKTTGLPARNRSLLHGDKAAHKTGKWGWKDESLQLLRGHLDGQSFFFPQDTLFKDGVVDLRLLSERSMRFSLMVRVRMEEADPFGFSGYGVTVEGGRFVLERWERGARRSLHGGESVKKPPAGAELRIRLWMVGPLMVAQLFSSEEKEPLATVMAMDTLRSSGMIGVRVGRRGKRKVKILQLRASGTRVERVEADAEAPTPVGIHRYLVVDPSRLAVLPKSIRDSLTLDDLGAPEGQPTKVEVQTNTRGAALLVRAGLVGSTELRGETAFRDINAPYRDARRQPRESHRHAFTPSGHYKSPSMVEEMLRHYVDAYPEWTERVLLGHSSRGRPIWALRLFSPGTRDKSKPSILLNGAHHGEELMSTEVVLDAIEVLLSQKDEKRIHAWLDGLDIWCVPLVNPDGAHLFLETSHHGGRKNVRDMNGNGVFDEHEGIDLNRNYPFHWGKLAGRGSSSHRQSGKYRGLFAGSELETQAMMRLTAARRFVASISFHTSATVILYPYTTSKAKDPKRNEAKAIAEAMAKAAPKQATKRKFRVKKNMYPVDGVDQDWFRAAHGTVALLIELALHNPPDIAKKVAVIEGARPAWQSLLDRVLHGPRVSGHLRDSVGKPIHGAVTLKGQEGRMGERWTSRCSDGRFDRLLQGKKGTLQVDVAGHERYQKRVAGNVWEEDLALPPATENTREADECDGVAGCAVDVRCALREGICPEVGPPRYCLIEDRCVEKGKMGPSSAENCDPSVNAFGWTTSP